MPKRKRKKKEEKPALVKESKAIANSALLEEIKTLKHIKEQRAELKEVEDELKKSIVAKFKGFDVLEFTDKKGIVKAIYKGTTRKTFSKKEFEKDHPELCSDYTKESTVNTLLIK